MEFNQEQFFSTILFESFGKDIPIKSFRFTSGGCINNTLQLETGEGTYFLKWNEDVDENMFEAENAGLELLKKSNEVHVPNPIHHGNINGKKYLLMEYLEGTRQSTTYWEHLGHELAALHSIEQSFYGLNHQNYIGKLPQKNTRYDSWPEFFIQNRLEVQLGLAIYNKQVDTTFVKKFRSIYPKIEHLLIEEKPSLVHGDLWSGNIMTGPGGLAYLIDPAVYYGSREVDLAMTKMFGGFDQRFYDAYEEVAPTEPGLEERIDIYNLYNIMVHVNLFGSSYLQAAIRTVNKFK